MTPNSPADSAATVAAADAPMLAVTGVSVAFERERVLDAVDMHVEPGTIHTLIGPNGAGKTTLIRAVMGGLPHEGDIRLYFRESGRLGYVPQFLDFDHSLPITVRDFFKLFLDSRAAFAKRPSFDWKDAGRWLERTGTHRLLDQRIGSLSGGELRRVLLAQALTPLPEFLILDEPASNVDEHGARIIEEILTELRDEHGTTILMVAHDLAMVRRVADFVTGLNRRAIFEGPAAQLADEQHVDALFGVGAAPLGEEGP
ncbi:MAG: metal ABC transporter ATP-binding protein [Deltaproteobacteria bacterium]|nr:metal ABC transporter ATP-binding protein [Deltaproteobacteria bacterium]MCB9479152.1 metal ABC transporter ATP-binding protein [Deltaproteobacteria bacterium]MCB9489177.1 metal ABC transporter ATP-binding protein [Deltaproteobacteria bacterium]